MYHSQQPYARAAYEQLFQQKRSAKRLTLRQFISQQLFAPLPHPKSCPRVSRPLWHIGGIDVPYVFRDRIKYRDRWRERIVHDTVIHTDSITQVIEHPPRKVIPPFYKRCTALFWTLMALLIL